MTIAQLNSSTLEQGTLGSTASKALPMGFLTKGALKYIGDAFLFVTKPHPEPFLGESGVCESRGKTEDENNLEGKGNCL